MATSGGTGAYDEDSWAGVALSYCEGEWAGDSGGNAGVGDVGAASDVVAVVGNAPPFVVSWTASP